MLAAQDVAQRCKELGITALHIKLRATGGNRTKTPGPGAQSALRAFACSGMKMGQIKDVTPIPSDSTCRKEGRRGRRLQAGPGSTVSAASITQLTEVVKLGAASLGSDDLETPGQPGHYSSLQVDSKHQQPDTSLLALLALNLQGLYWNPVPSYWSSSQASENYTAQNQTELTGSVVYNSQLQPTADNITCLTISKPVTLRENKRKVVLKTARREEASASPGSGLVWVWQQQQEGSEDRISRWNSNGNLVISKISVGQKHLR
ncbi:hypothetical protein MC885_017790 [Smutsia gigantea]|nr:hypothetical protein MC885_017790 [Smutsia gigantea]